MQNWLVFEKSHQNKIQAQLLITQLLLKSKIHATINRLKPRKSFGSDGIPAKITKAGGSILEEQIFRLYKMVEKKENLPEEWTKSIVITFPKKGDQGLRINYRTLSLVNHMCKIFLLVILKHLNNMIKPFLSEKHTRFRNNQSTVQ